MTEPDVATTFALARLRDVEEALAYGLDVIQTRREDYGGFAMGLDSLPLPQQRAIWRTWLARHAEPPELRAQYQELEDQT